MQTISTASPDAACNLSGAVAAAAMLVLAACADGPPQRRSPPPQARTRPAPEAPAPRPPPTTQVYVYPTAGQSEDRLSRDRYECYLWGVKQSGFDPSQTSLAPHQRVEVVPMPPSGTSTAAGAVAGAVIGAVIAGPHDAGEGAVAGAILGGAAGAVSDAQRQADAKRVQGRYDQREAARTADSKSRRTTIAGL